MNSLIAAAKRFVPDAFGPYGVLGSEVSAVLISQATYALLNSPQRIEKRSLGQKSGPGDARAPLDSWCTSWGPLRPSVERHSQK